MHLALLTLSFPPEIGGVQTYLAETMKRLAVQTAVTVITPVIPGQPAHAETFQRITIANGRAPAFWKALHQIKPDRVLLGHAHPQLLLAALAYKNSPYATLTYGNDYLAAQQRWHRPLFNWLLSRSRPLLTITNANQFRLQSLGLHDAVIIHPGTDPTRYAPLAEAKAAHPTLLTVGRLVSRKGFDLVLQALPTIRVQFPTTRLEIVGDGPHRPRLEQLAHELGVADMVTFHGRVSDNELLAAYRRAHIFVMPAREEKENASIEGFGIVYLEAGACGLPVVAGRSGGVAEAVLDGETGILVTPDNPEELAQALIMLLHDPVLQHKLGSNGRHRVETEMNWDQTAAKLLAALDR
ncbi:MAG: glycosyltransferase family 4 protein [Anaerolineae bacterium]|nr:glycosyltransferase family 4 protein [Anaerolineae bacterium]